MDEAALAATDECASAVARQPLGDDIRFGANRTELQCLPDNPTLGRASAAPRTHTTPHARAPARQLGVALLAGLLAVGASAQTDDHGDDRASATRVELPSETAGEIDPGDDEDWFRFEVAASTDVVAETTGTLDTYGALYDADGNALAVDDDLGGGFNFSITHTLDAGTYYVRVTSFGRATGSYVLRLLPLSGAPAVSDVTIFRPVSGDTFELAEDVAVGVTFDRTVALTGRLQLALTIGSNLRTATRTFSSTPPFRTRQIFFYYTVQPSDRDVDGISIGANALTSDGGAIRNAVGTTDAALSLGAHAVSNSANHKVDGRRESPPTVRGVWFWRVPSNDDTYELGEVITAGVYFDRRVDATAQATLALTVGASVRQAVMPYGSAQRVRSLRFDYVVQPSDRDADGISIGDGALTLNGGTIRTHRGNADASLSLGRYAISNSADYKVDGRRETALAVRWHYLSWPSMGDTFEVGDVIIGTVGFNRAVEVTGEPQLQLRIGAAKRQARYFGLSDEQDVRFQYVVRPSDLDEDGISVVESALTLNGGTIRTRGGQDAPLDLGRAISNSASHKVDGSREAAPTVTWTRIVSTPAGGDYSAGAEILVRVEFDRAVEVSGVPQLALTIGAATRQANYVEHLEAEHLEYGYVARDARHLYFRYVVQPSDRDADGISVGALSLNGGTITTQGTATNAELETAAAIDNDWIHKVNAGTARPDDHGNDLSSATRVALPSETAGAVGPEGDVDWLRFGFDASAPREVTAETTGGLDTVGALYDLGGNVLAEDDDSGGDLNFRIRRTLDAGTYFMRVASFESNTGSYVLRLEVEGNLRSLGDFDGDGKDDVLLRHEDGRWHYYPMDGRAVLDGSGEASLTTNRAWRAAGFGDFDGDDRDDVLLRHDDGRWRYYAMDGRARRPGGGAASLTTDLAWRIASLGDFDGDGKDDVLLRHEDGRWHYYPMDGRTVLDGSGEASLTADLAWRIAGFGDFNGDGKDDVLLRHEDGRWHYYPMDGRTVLDGGGEASLTTNRVWRVAGFGDFNGDGRDDVLLRHEDGRWRYYAMNGRTVRSGGGGINLAADTTTTVVAIGDMNGDGRDDVLTRTADGSWQYYALDGRRVLSASGEAALTGDLAWGLP